MCKVITSPVPGLEAKIYTYEAVRDVQTVATTMQLITSVRTDRVALVTIVLNFGENFYKSQPTQIHHSLRYYYENLRPLVRRTDEVFPVGHKFYFFLLGADLQGGAIVQERLWDALLWRIHNTNEEDIQRPHSVSMGHAAYPVPSKTIKQCLASADKVCLSFDAHPEKAMSPAEKLDDGQKAVDTELPILARKLGIPYLALLPHKPSTNVQRLVSCELAQELGCYPLGRERDVLTVAMSNPPDGFALERLRQETGLAIFPVLVPPRELQTALKQLI